MGLDTLDETKPFDTDPVSFGDDMIRETRAKTKESFFKEHYLSGEHGFPIGGPTTHRPPAGKYGRLFINTSNNTIEYDNGGAWVATGASLVPGSVGSDVLAPGCVTGDKLGANSVTGDKILNGTITGDDIANGSIGTEKLAGLIDGNQISNKSIWGDYKIADRSIWGSRQIAQGSITYLELIAGAAISQHAFFGFPANIIIAANQWASPGACTITTRGGLVLVVSVSGLSTYGTSGGSISVHGILSRYRSIQQGGQLWSSGTRWLSAPGVPVPTLLSFEYPSPGTHTYFANYYGENLGLFGAANWPGFIFAIEFS